jgi:hypothetical protein
MSRNHMFGPTVDSGLAATLLRLNPDKLGRS